MWHRKRGVIMSPRTGRPKSDNPLSVEVKARIDIQTNEQLNEHCQKTGKTRTEVVRIGIDKVLNEKK